jgi:CBS domain-containing protein
MEDIFVGQLMSSPVQTVAPETPAHEGAETMLEQDIGSLVVVVGDEPEGILTSTDCVELVADRASTEDALVEDYMSTVSTTTTANEPIQDAADRMIDDGVHHLPVVEETEGVIGVLTTTDLTAYLSHDRTPDLA